MKFRLVEDIEDEYDDDDDFSIDLPISYTPDNIDDWALKDILNVGYNKDDISRYETNDDTDYFVLTFRDGSQKAWYIHNGRYIPDTEFSSNITEDSEDFDASDYIGRPLKDFLKTIDHRTKISIDSESGYDEHGNQGITSGLSGRAHDVEWYLADKEIKSIEVPEDKRFYDYKILIEGRIPNYKEKTLELNEDLFDNVAEVVTVESPEVQIETTATTEGLTTPTDRGLSDVILSLINDENEAIQGYNSFIATLEQFGTYEDFISVINDINAEELNHVGMLQTLLKKLSPNAENIESGKAEAEDILVDDKIEDDSFLSYYVPYEA